jgi:hypothetical protein
MEGRNRILFGAFACRNLGRTILRSGSDIPERYIAHSTTMNQDWTSNFCI